MNVAVKKARATGLFLLPNEAKKRKLAFKFLSE